MGAGILGGWGESPAGGMDGQYRGGEQVFRPISGTLMLNNQVHAVARPWAVKSLSLARD